MLNTYVYIGEMSAEYPQRLVVIGGPEPGGLVVGGRGKIVAVRGEARVPHGVHVAAVAHQALPRVQGPQSDWKQSNIKMILPLQASL